MVLLILLYNADVNAAPLTQQHKETHNIHFEILSICWPSVKPLSWFESVCVRDDTGPYAHARTHRPTQMHNRALPLPRSIPSAYVSIWLPPRRDRGTDWSRFDSALEVPTRDGGQRGEEKREEKGNRDVM